MTTASVPTLLDRHAVEVMTAMSTSTLYDAMARGAFPRPVRIGKRSVRWKAHEVQAWIESRPRALGALAEARGAR